jgi:hypothetical protein
MPDFTQKPINKAFGADNDKQYGDYVVMHVSGVTRTYMVSQEGTCEL